MAPTLLHIGGDRLQLAVIRSAHEAGLVVVVADDDPQAPARGVADRHASVAADDVAGITSLALSIHAEGELVGATCLNDRGLDAIAAIGEATGAPATPPAAVRAALDRGRARAAWHAVGIASTPVRAAESSDDLRAALDELGLPAIVEPADVRAGRAGRTVHNEAEAVEAFEALRQRGRDVLVERRVAGRRLGVSAYFRDGAYIPCGIHERFLSHVPHRIAQGAVLPSSLRRSQRREVHALVERAARALGISIGPLMADVVWADDGPLVLDVAPRFHDGVVAAVASFVFGKSPLQAWFAALVDAGGPFDAMPTRPLTQGGWLAITADHAGVLHGVTGVERARTAPGIRDVVLLRGPGHVIRDAGDESATIGYLCTDGWDDTEVKERLHAARERMSVEVERVAAA